MGLLDYALMYRIYGRLKKNATLHGPVTGLVFSL
jgi:hypothetical protein